MLFYDRLKGEHCYVAKEMVATVLASYDTTRYETNYDTYTGTLEGVAHFTARDDAAPSQSVYSNDVAATSCYYRIEIEVGAGGSITFSAASGNASIASTTITWSASNTLAEIVAMFTAKNASYITFAKLADDKGVGVEIGGYGTNALTVTALSGCSVIDCSGYAFLRSKNAAAPAVGETFDPRAAWDYLNTPTVVNNILGVHHNFRGASARSILGTSLVDANSTAIAVDGYNYSYRCGVNFAKFKSWASTNGDSSFYDDGEDEQSGSSHVTNPGAHVMKEATFKTEVVEYTGSDVQRLGMQDYYTHLFTDQSGEYADWRHHLEAMYGQMMSIYDAYLMNHMLDAGANSGITSTMRNKGFDQTVVKADCMNVTYNYVIIPAYPPEYNAQHYGVEASEGFTPGKYYHPEPADIALMFRDDNMPLINANIVASGGGTQLTNSIYRGSCADYYATGTWYFSGANGCFNYGNRCYGTFRCRPSLALPLPN